MKKPDATKTMTIREFAASLGLKKTGLDYIASTVLMRLLCKQGIAKKVGKVSLTPRGRPSDLFRVPTEFTLRRKRRRRRVAA